ncbi:MAG: hypothetical protein ACYC0Z_13170 [Acidobacteriaceae bacterium]
MNTQIQSLAAALEAAISAYAEDVPGTWKVVDEDGYIQLVWECEAADTDEMYGDEPWCEWGGNQIIEAAGAPDFNDSGCDSYIDKYGDAITAQWVQWNK